MARGNPQNLIPQAHVLSVEEQSKGGQKSGETRRLKKTNRTILNDFLESDCDSVPILSALATQLGITDEASVKQIVTMTCVLNSVKNGDVRDLETLQKLLGEETGKEDEEDTGVQVIIDV